MRLVIKFGGKTLETSEKLKNCVNKVAKLKEDFDNIVVVVSAMGDTTNKLYSTYLELAGNKINTNELEQFITLGEIQSTMLFQSALNSLSLKAKAVLPYDTQLWPIVIERKDFPVISQEKVNDEINFNLLFDFVNDRVKRIEEYLNKDFVVVIPGFIALDKNNQIVTLGRGGSDTSAAIISTLLDADNLYIVTDVAGVLTGDPKFVNNPEPIKKLTLRELQIISGAGARVVHPSVLKYIKPKTQLKIVDTENLLKDGGTIIEIQRDMELKVYPNKIGVVTLLGSDLQSQSGILIKLLQPISQLNISILDITVNHDYIALYLEEGKTESAYKTLHSLIGAYKNVFKSIAMKKNLGKITVASNEFIDTPGILHKLIKPISEKAINIYEIVTVMKDITIFTDYNDIENVGIIIKEALGLN